MGKRPLLFVLLSVHLLANPALALSEECRSQAPILSPYLNWPVSRDTQDLRNLCDEISRPGFYVEAPKRSVYLVESNPTIFEFWVRLQRPEWQATWKSHLETAAGFQSPQERVAAAYQAVTELFSSASFQALSDSSLGPRLRERGFRGPNVMAVGLLALAIHQVSKNKDLRAKFVAGAADDERPEIQQAWVRVHVLQKSQKDFEFDLDPLSGRQSAWALPPRGALFANREAAERECAQLRACEIKRAVAQAKTGSAP